MAIGVLACGFTLFGFGSVESKPIQLTVVYNNLPFNTHLKTAWGFSCLIEGTAQTILFDTGGNGNLLLENMRLLGKDPMDVGLVFLSHIHIDHTGGRDAFLRLNPHATVCIPESFSTSFQRDILHHGAHIKVVKDFTRLLDRVHSSGEMGSRIKEQSLILQTPKGLVVITGCAHPGIIEMVRKAREHFKEGVYLVMGGFHLASLGDAELHEIMRELKKIGVKKVAPSHCTGDKAVALFREVWGDHFLEGGLGAIIRIPK